MDNIKNLIIRIKKFFFMTKMSWLQGAAFGRKYGRVPNDIELDEMEKLCDIEWQKINQKK